MHLLHSKRGLFDAFPVSVISLQTVAAVSALVGRELEPLRFRPNIVIDAPGSDFPEEAWIGREVRVGAARIRLDVRDTRCMVINFDPRTAERDPPCCGLSPSTARTARPSTAPASSPARCAWVTI